MVVGKDIERIAIVSPGLSGGGAERVASILANRFFEKGISILFVCVFSSQAEYFLHPGVELVFIDSKGRGRLSKTAWRNVQIWRLLNEFSPDVTLSFLDKEIIFSEIRGTRVVPTLRYDPYFDCGLMPTLFRKISFYLSSSVVFQTDGARSYFSKKVQSKGVILPNPVEVSAMPSWKSDSGSKTFVTAGRLAPEKNQMMLIEAFAPVSKEHPDYTLDIYGVGPLESSLRERIQELGVQNCVHLRGRCKNFPEVLSSSFAFILPSDSEGVSNAMLEALCVGVPSVVTDHSPGGARAYIHDGVNGLLTPTGDVRKMAEAIKYIIEGGQKVIDMGTEGRKVADSVNADTAAEMWLSHLKGLMND